MCNLKCGSGGCAVSMIAKILLIVGGVNWGLVGLGMLLDEGMDWNVVHMALSSMSTLHLEGLVYLLVGVAAIMSIFSCKCRKCTAGCAACGADSKIGSSM